MIWAVVIIKFDMYVEFAEYPMNITLLIGSETEAVFRCQHQSLEANIVWSVNRSLVGLFPDITPGFIRENGSLVSTLTIPARSKYNGTEVMCGALFINGSLPAVTPPVTLTIIAGLYINYSSNTHTS